MAVGPRKKLKRKVEEYLRNQRVLSYPFEYSCSQKGMSRRRLLATPGGCVLDDWYVDGDSRGPRPLALARYEMYETWLRQYSSTSYALVLDTRDTFFQRDPFCCRRPLFFFGLPRHRRNVVPVAVSARWRGDATVVISATSAPWSRLLDGVDSTPSTRRCLRGRVGSMAWRLAEVALPPRRRAWLSTQSPRRTRSRTSSPRRPSHTTATARHPHNTRRVPQVRLARPEEAEKGPGPRQGLVCVRGERPQDRRFVSMEPGLVERVLSGHAERPVGARAVLRKHAGF
jgi:hypothetical protein